MERAETVMFSVILVFFWAVILCTTYLVYLLSDVFRCFGNGILPYLVAGLYVLAFVVPILLRKRLKGILSMPAALILSTVAAVIAAVLLLAGTRSYISEFTPKKWENDPSLRTYMIGDLEKEYGIIGMSGEEITALLGDPTDLPSDAVWEYFVGVGFMDPYGYQITFENGVAVSTEIVEH